MIIARIVDSTLIGVMTMRLIDADKLKADLEKAISKNEDKEQAETIVGKE